MADMKKIISKTIPVQSNGRTDIIDITGQAADLLAKSNLRAGIITFFISGSTAGITTIEFEPGLLQDLPEAFEKLAPMAKRYHHDATWGDGNGYAHVRAAMLGPSLTVPFKSGRMLLGTWQQIVIIDFDNRPRQREVVMQIFGDEHDDPGQ
jgi:secondary thiamine-phosphate synthase enzyme